MSKIIVGSIVAPREDSRFVLASGGERYKVAVCVSVEPFILVSRSTDMLWSVTVDIGDFESCGVVDFPIFLRIWETRGREIMQRLCAFHESNQEGV